MRFLLLLPFLIGGLSSQAQNPNYDSTLARQLGADEYGMKSYILVILSTGPNSSTDKAYRDSCFAGHFENMNNMEAAGKLLVAGPIGKNDLKYRGIFILNAASVEEAAQLLQGDLAVKEGFLEPLYFNWYGSAALPLYLDDTERIWQKKF
jgi:uncharacterized protein